MTKDRRVDPVHFFNSEGVPVLNLQHLLERNALLEHQIQRLTRMLRAQVARNKAITEDARIPVVH